MTEEVKKQFKVGDAVWHARCAWLAVKKPCPICFGDLKVKLILGNGDEVTLPCECCSRGYEPPTGYIEEYEHVIEPQLVVITSVTTITTAAGQKEEYRSDPFVYETDLLFLTKEEAAAKGVELKAELDAAQLTKATYLKEKAAKSFSWNAGYHLREAKRERASAERHEQKAALCKARSKEKE